MLASDAKLSASRGFESQCRRFAFSFGVHIQRARLARLALAAGRELETDYIDTGFLQFPYFFGALSLKGQRQEANAIQNGGGGGGGSAAAGILLAHTAKNFKQQKGVGYRADMASNQRCFGDIGRPLRVISLIFSHYRL